MPDDQTQVQYDALAMPLFPAALASYMQNYSSRGAQDDRALAALMTLMQQVKGAVDVCPARLDVTAVSSSLAELTTIVNNVLPIGTFSVATMPAAAAQYLGRVAIVTDLFGERYTRMRCERVGTNFYFWQPQSSDSAKSYTMTGNMTVDPLNFPQGIRLNGSIGLGINRTISLSTVGGWPGAKKDISAAGLSGLGGLNVLGVGLTSAVNVVLGGYKKFMMEFDGTKLVWTQII